MAETDDIAAELNQRAALEGEFIPRPAETPTDQPAFDAAAVRPLVSNLWRAIFIAMAPYWLSEEIAPEHRITAASIDQISDASIVVINKYLPWLIEKFPELWMLAATIGITVLPPILAGIPRRKPEADADADKTKTHDAAQTS